MTEFHHELRLLWSIALNGGLFFAARRLARVGSDADRLQIWIDSVLLWWTMQYVIVGGLGLIGLLTPAAISIAAAAVVVLVVVLTPRPKSSIESSSEDDWVTSGLAFVIAFVAAVIWGFRDLPAMADDPLTYHLPAAATWLQQGRITVYETWYFNPANSYSPLAGSVFAAWLIAPFGHDVLARFMQAPAVIAIFLAATQIARRLGAPIQAAVLVGAAAALCRPIVGQAALAKDDLFLTAFVLIAMGSIGSSERLAPWRIGISLGLAAATKFTAAYSLVPLLLLAVPMKSIRSTNIRRAGIAAACIVAIAGPWYFRNWLCYGNPLFPVRVEFAGKELLPGLFTTTATPRLREAAGLLEIFITGYFATGVTVAVVAAVLWMGAVVFGVRRALQEPLVRVILFAPPLGIGLFILTSPYGEVRFVYVWILTMICAAALWPGKLVVAASAIVFAAAVGTSFAPDWMIVFALTAVVGALASLLVHRFIAPRLVVRKYLAIALCLGAVGSIWVWWRAYVDSLPQLAAVAWRDKYGPIAVAWELVRKESAPGQTIAVTGTFLTYPLMGEKLDRKVIHVPVSKSVVSLDRIPRIPTPLSARNMLREIIPTYSVEADREAWINRMRSAGVRFLVINFRPRGSAPVPVEWLWAARDSRFKQVLLNPEVAVFRVEME